MKKSINSKKIAAKKLMMMRAKVAEGAVTVKKLRFNRNLNWLMVKVEKSIEFICSSPRSN